MAENENGQEKTEEATPKRLEKAREEGQVARSRELATMMVLLAGVGGMLIFGTAIGKAMLGVMAYNFSLPRNVAFDEKLMIAHFGVTSTSIIEALIPLFVCLIAAAFIGPSALGGVLFSSKALAPKFSRIDPLKGIKRIFSLNSLVELMKSIAKILIVGSVAYVMFQNARSDILGLAQMPLEPAIDLMLSIVVWTILAVSASMIFVVLIDVPYQIYDHKKKMKMTRQEVKDEMKDSEGKPEVKGRIRQLQMQLAQRRMMESVPEADVVITNPEHFSVALKYDVEGGGAPVVVAKGVDFLAIKIREIAKANDVMILAAPPLARAIYFTTEIDDEIPGNLYLAVAQVLAYVFQLKTHRAGKGSMPKPLAEIEIPREAQYDTDGTPQPEA